MESLLGLGGPPPAGAPTFPYGGGGGGGPLGAGAKTGRASDGAATASALHMGPGDMKPSAAALARAAAGMDQGVMLLGAGEKEDGADSEGEEDEAAPLDIDDLLEEPLCEKVKGLGTFYILIDKHSRKRKRGFTGLRRSQKAAIVRCVRKPTETGDRLA